MRGRREVGGDAEIKKNDDGKEKRAQVKSG